MAAVRDHPLMRRWYDEAAQEPAAWLIPHYEAPAGWPA
jgi:glutathione S-transferase